MWFNFHSHCRYCDGRGKPSDYLQAGIERNFFTIGFSSHAPLPFDCKWSMKQTDLQSYLDEINSLKASHQGIGIYKGLEVDFIPNVVSPANFRSQLDYTIGSIHFIDAFPDGRRWEIDNTQAVFQEGLQKIFAGSFKSVVQRYFSLTREMVESSHPDVIGHIDKIKMQNIDGKYFSESDAWYREEIEKTLKTIADAGSIVEVNTRGIYQKKTTTTYPSPWILTIIREKNIPITISSDAHDPKDLTNNFTETSKELLALGFSKLSVFFEGSWKQLPFNENGIIR